MALYKKFYDKYSVKDFAKHRDKYVRYDLDKLKAALDKFFWDDHFSFVFFFNWFLDNPIVEWRMQKIFLNR